MAASTSPPSHRPTRLYDVDWLRVLATLTVFAYHCGRVFDSMEPWHIKNRQLTDALTVPMVLGAQFMMPLFFILSGISTYYALGSRPASAFLRRRVVRLVVPLVTLGWFLLCPPQVYIEAVTVQGYHAPPFQGTFWQFLPHYFEGRYGLGGYFAWNGMHLWYLLWLTGCTLLAMPILLYLRSSSGKRLVTALADVLERPGAIFLLALPLLLPELLLAPGPFFLSWREGGWAFATHLIMFVTGFLLVSDGRLRLSLQRQRWVALGLAVITLFPLANWAPQMGDLPFGSLQHAVQWGLRTINGWLWLAAILGFGSLHLNFAHATLAYAGQAVLPFYVLHQTVIVILGYAIRDWPLGLFPKYLLLTGSAFAICISLYEFVIRRRNWLRFLFGMGPKPAQ